MEVSDNLKKITQLIRQEKSKEERDEIKKQLPAIIVSADTQSRNASPDDKRTGLIFIDLDGSDNPDTDLEKVVDSMACHYPWLIGYFTSPSGDGLKVLCGIQPDAETHLRSFKALDVVFNEHGLNVDQSCKDLKRLTFLCHDPDIERTLIEPLEEWNGERITPVPPVERKDFKGTRKLSTGTAADHEAALCLEHLDPDMYYHDWISVGMALKDHGACQSVWDDWSSGGETYKPGECERKWESFKGSGVTFGTLVHMAKAANGGKNPLLTAQSLESGYDDTDFEDLGPDDDMEMIGGEVYGKKPPQALLKKTTTGTVYHLGKQFHQKDKPEALPKIVSLGELMQQFPHTPAAVIDGVIGIGDKLILSAPPKLGKTWLMLNLAYAVQNGEYWLGHRCRRMNALYVNFELSQAWAAERTRLLNTNRSSDEHPDILNLRGYDVTWPRLSQHIGDHIKASSKEYGIIILDPIYKMLGDCDENANGDIARLLNSLERMGHTNRAAIAFSHHHSKGNKSRVDTIERMSGAGVWGRDPDTIIDLVGHEDEDCYTVEAITRNYPKPPKQVVRWDFPHFVTVANADPGQLRKPGGSKKKLTEANVVAMCKQTPAGLSRPALLTKLANAHSVSEETARNRVNDALEKGSIKMDGKLIKPSGTTDEKDLIQSHFPNPSSNELGKAV